MKMPETVTVTAQLLPVDYELVAAAAAAEGIGVNEWAAIALPLMAAECLQEFLSRYIDELTERGIE